MPSLSAPTYDPLKGPYICARKEIILDENREMSAVKITTVSTVYLDSKIESGHFGEGNYPTVSGERGHNK